MDRLPHPEPLSGTSYSAVELMPNNAELVMLDQRRLPAEECYVRLASVSEVKRAIAEMLVRGAPAIGISAAYGIVLAAHGARTVQDFSTAAAELGSARPTAVNLRWAIERMLEHVRTFGIKQGLVESLAEAARRLHREDVAANRRLGKLGAERISDAATVLTHCNAGALATGGYGTALGVIRAAREAGKELRVLADETRPYLQGSRLTAWELARDGIAVEVIADAGAASFFKARSIDLVVVGADRIAQNGDVANKIGTYGIACLAHMHERPFYVAAPWSTVDMSCPDAAAIPIEERSEAELGELGGVRVLPDGVRVRNPAFDVTEASLISAIFTERGAVEPVGAPALARLAAAEPSADT
jgi:methylthioribose-1-phosphate isomerase